MSCRRFHSCCRFGSCRPKGAARMQALSKYKFLCLFHGVISPVTVSIRQPKAAPNLDSKPMSGHRLRLRSALWTSATCMAIDFGEDAPSVHISHRFSTRDSFIAKQKYKTPKIEGSLLSLNYSALQKVFALRCVSRHSFMGSLSGVIPAPTKTL